MKLQNVILVMGPPGSGKGTQSKLLASKLEYEYFSTGELSREYAKHDTEFGKRVKSIIDQGLILPIDIINEIFVKKFESLTDSTGIILDGYPRALDQLNLLEELLQKHEIKKPIVFFLNVDRNNLVNRLQKRKTCSKCGTIYNDHMQEYKNGICSKCGGELVSRADDDPAVIIKRFDEYHVKTAPVKEYFEAKGLLININGDQSIEEVQKEILSKLEQA